MNTRTERLHNEAVVVDGHKQIMIEFSLRKDRGEENIFASYYAPLIRKGGVNVLDMVVGSDDPSLSNLNDNLLFGALSLIDLLLEEEANGDDFKICRSAGDINSALAADKIAVLLKFEVSRPIEGRPDQDSLSLLRTFYRLGLRGICLVWAGQNRIGTGVGEVETNARLTTFGVAVVQEMNRLGMVVDVAHMTDPCFYDVLEVTRDPIVDSHSNAYAVCNHPRNLSDGRIRAMAENIGVIGIMFQKAMIKKDSYVAGERVTVDDLMEHIDYIANLVVVDHIALGPDYSGFGKSPAQCGRRPGWIEGLYYGNRKSDCIDGPDEVTKFKLIRESFTEQGYSAEDIKKILGGNLLRLLRKVLS